MAPLATYYATKATIKALAPTQRRDGYTRATRTDNGDPEWYMFVAASTANVDDDLVLMPDDNPPVGRWHKYAAMRGSSDSSSSNFDGGITCTTNCSIGGKVFAFYAPQTNLEIIIRPGFDIAITPGSKSIQLHRWNQQPTDFLWGRQFVAEMPETGGAAIVTVDSIHRWISIFAKNPSNGGQYDGVCFTRSGNIFTLIGYQ
jgi:hypothetical protein